SITREPYDAQHLPFNTIKFIKNDSAFEFAVQVPRDADIVTTKKKVSTTSQEGGEPADAEDAPQQGQRGAGAGNGQRAPQRTRTLRFEYDLASGKVTLDEDYAPAAPRPRWASLSPDGQ